MPLGEFDIIDRYFAARGPRRDDVRLGIGDDAALLAVPAGQLLVAAVDAVIDGVHLPQDRSGADLGHRALAVNLSDLAAMGAEPAWATLSLSIPSAEPEWLEDFAGALFALAERYGVALVGGDTTCGPRSATVGVFGFVPEGAALTRAGATRGDALYVTGTPGDAAAGLALLGGAPGSEAADHLRGRFLRPEPRVVQGLGLRGIASAAIDISDGLAADADKLARASAVGLELHVHQLPLSAALEAERGLEAGRRLALEGGDDYELLFTVPPAASAALERVARGWACGCTRIGEVVAGTGVRALLDGRPLRLAASGYQHF